MLSWRRGAPRLIPLPFVAQFDERIGNFDTVREIAVWDDGSLVAHTELRSPFPPVIDQGIDALADRLQRRRPQPPPIWQLTLYRNGRNIGRFRLPMRQLPPRYSLTEHLAFTADGRYLSWVIGSRQDTRLFVFATR